MASSTTIEPRGAYLCDFFDEDIVYRFTPKGQVEVGVVVESCENASSDEEDDDSEDIVKLKKKFKRLKPGTTKVSWFPRGSYETLPEKKVKLMDRSLLPGDVVRYIDPAKSDLIGYCKKTDINFCLKILGTNKVLENVSSNDLDTLNPTQSDIVCIYKSWIGYIDDTCFNVTLMCKDGSIVILQDEDLTDFDDVLDEKNRTCQFSSEHFYVGQRLIGPRKALQKGNWIHQTLEMSASLASRRQRKRRIQATVIKVELASISCRWLCCIHGGVAGNNDTSNNKAPKETTKIESKESIVTQPPPQQSAPTVEDNHEDSDSSLKENYWCARLDKFGTKVIIEKCPDLAKEVDEVPCEILHGDQIKEVKVLNYFQKCTLQVGDLGYYNIKATDELIDYEQFIKSHTQKILRERFDKQVYTGDLLDDQINGLADDEDNSEYDDLPDEDSLLYPFEDESLDIGQSLNDGLTHDKKSIRKKKGPSVSVKKVKQKKLKPSKKYESKKYPVDCSPGRRVAVQIVSTETKVDVIWQSNEITSDIPSYLLYPMHHLDGHEFFPGDFIIENKEGISFLDYGVVQKVDHNARTALVKWFKSQSTDLKPSFLSEEYVSAYDIKDHPDHHYRAGCCVIRVDAIASGTLPSNPASRAGQVVECNIDAQLLCAWADGSQCQVYPQELFIIGDYDSDDLWDSDFEIEEVSLDGSLATNAIEQPASIKQTPQNTAAKRRRSSAAGSLENLLDKLRNTVLQLEEYFIQNPSPNYRNGISMMNQIYKLARLCKSLDENLGTSLVALNNLRSLIEAVKPPPSSSSGRIQIIANKLMKLLPSSSTDCDRRESSFSNDSGKESDESEEEDVIEASTTKGLTSIPTTASPRMSLTINIPNCQDYLKQLKRSLFSVFSNLQSIKRLYETKPDIVTDFQEDDVAVPSHQGKRIFVESSVKEEESKDGKCGAAESPEIEPNEDFNRKGGFQMIESVPNSHTYKLSVLQPSDQFFKRIRKEISLLQTSLPPDIHVKTFEDRLDLYSVMIKGPQATPYEDGLFLFDIQLPADYPKVPPWVHYISYCIDRLNPNLYECGKVCISLLGTWTGKGTEVWDGKNSTLLQLLLSIQGLILVSEPYYNEAGYMRQKGTCIGQENSRLYNEMAVVKMVQSMSKLAVNLNETFKQEIEQHFKSRVKYFVDRIEAWLKISEYWNTNHAHSNANNMKQILIQEGFNYDLPEFPLLPGSQGFCLSLRKALSYFKENLLSLNINYS